MGREELWAGVPGLGHYFPVCLVDFSHPSLSGRICASHVVTVAEGTLVCWSSKQQGMGRKCLSLTPWTRRYSEHGGGAEFPGLAAAWWH